MSNTIPWLSTVTGKVSERVYCVKQLASASLLHTATQLFHFHDPANSTGYTTLLFVAPFLMASKSDAAAPVVHALAGSVGSMLAMTAFFPLDVLKTRMQVCSDELHFLGSLEVMIGQSKLRNSLAAAKKGDFIL